MTAELRDALAHRSPAPATDGLELTEVSGLAQVSLRSDPRSIAGSLELPLEPNTFLERDGRVTLWLGPDEWLVVAPHERFPSLATDLDRALAPRHRSVVDVSANRVVLQLRGPDALDALATGCPIDLHPRAWTAGQCAQTLAMDTQAILVHLGHETSWVLVRPSFAEHLVTRWVDGASLLMAR
ncbi:MAG: sarcosine oxidase subunit gamma family protein [Actinomycetota bacterium]